jgi:ubiquinol-cytochrome c reductase iron-sulfur subunit
VSEEPRGWKRIARGVAAVWTVRRLGAGSAEGPAAEPPIPLDAELSPEEDPSERIVPASPRSESVVAGMLIGAAICGFGFLVCYILDQLDAQLLGLCMGLMFLFLAAAAIVAGKFVVPQETAVEPREPLYRPDDTEQVVDMIRSGGEGVSRRKLLVGAGGVAAAGVACAAATPLASLGPRLTQIHKVPWKKGLRMVAEDGTPYLASDIVEGSFYAAFPEGKSWEQLGAPVNLVRLPKHYIHLPHSRLSWAPHGIMAFSRICPHAACAVSLYRYPTYGPTSSEQPAFTCPCHYSTFLPGYGGKLIFGPAGRPLPQLPVEILPDGHLAAGGYFDEDVGPSWVDIRRPRLI